MNSLWIAALLLSWLAIAALALAVYALARQIGVLHERIRPAGALSVAPMLAPGDAVPAMNLPCLNGGTVTIGGRAPDGRAQLLLFIAPDCPLCQELVPTALALARGETERLQLIFASDGAPATHQDYIRQRELSGWPYLLSAELGQRLHIGRLPYGVLIDADGRLVAHGLCNTREHLDSLLEAQERGVASVQQWIGKQEAHS